MIDDPLFQQALGAVRNDPARNAFVRTHSYRSIAVYDAVKKELEERAECVKPGQSLSKSDCVIGNWHACRRRSAQAADCLKNAAEREIAWMWFARPAMMRALHGETPPPIGNPEGKKHYKWRNSRRLARD